MGDLPRETVERLGRLVAFVAAVAGGGARLLAHRIHLPGVEERELLRRSHRLLEDRTRVAPHQHRGDGEGPHIPEGLLHLHRLLLREGAPRHRLGPDHRRPAADRFGEELPLERSERRVEGVEGHQHRVPGEAALEELEPDVRGLLPVEPQPAHPPLVPRLLGGVEPPVVVDPIGIVVVDHLVERPELHPVGLEEPQGGLELLHRRLVVPQVGAALPDELHPVAVAVLEGEGDPLLHPSLPVLGGDLQDADAEVDGLADQGDGPLLAEGREAAGGEAHDGHRAVGAA